MKTSVKEKDRLLHKYGEWAIVTGASSGIGLELAMQLADAGLNLVISARGVERLDETAKQLRARSAIEVRIVAADAATTDGIDKITGATRDLNIGMLIVSAGYGTSGALIDNPLQTELDMLRVNCEGLLNLTHFYARQFAAQRRGGIILMSSIVAFQGTPYAANYAATKAYVQTLAEGLAVELKPYGVDVLAAAPGPVKSGFGSRSNMNITSSLSPSQVGIPILHALGRRTTVLPGLLTKILFYSLQLLPRWGKVKVMGTVMADMTKHQK
jgi:uncharacterized protein